MRASRAYIAGFGTTSVLVASAVLLLAVVSALVAFQGWPGTGFGEDTGTLVVDEPERLTVERPLQVALGASPAAAVASSPAPDTAAAATPTRSPAAAPADVRRAPVLPLLPRAPDEGDAGFLDEPPPPEASDTPDPDQLAGGLLPETPLTSQVNRLTQGLGDTTQGVTDGLGSTVGSLNPQLGLTLTEAGRLLAELLRSLGRPAP